MLALIAGTGDLPPAIVARLNVVPVVCALDGFVPSVPVDVTFRLETLGSLLADLKTRGVTQICMAGAIQRPQIDPSMIDAATLPLVPVVMAALAQGDDGALRAVIGVFEAAGFVVKAAHEIAPDLLPQAGIATKATPLAVHRGDAGVGEAVVAQMGAADIGQACVICDGLAVATEGAAGTAAMLDSVTATGGILFKAPKPGQDRRADLPVIGLETVAQVVTAGLAGIVIEADGVMVLDYDGVCAALDAQGLFLWVRPRGQV